MPVGLAHGGVAQGLVAGVFCVGLRGHEPLYSVNWNFQSTGLDPNLERSGVAIIDGLPAAPVDRGDDGSRDDPSMAQSDSI